MKPKAELISAIFASAASLETDMKIPVLPTHITHTTRKGTVKFTARLSSAKSFSAGSLDDENIHLSEFPEPVDTFPDAEHNAIRGDESSADESEDSLPDLPLVPRPYDIIYPPKGRRLHPHEVRKQDRTSLTEGPASTPRAPVDPQWFQLQLNAVTDQESALNEDTREARRELREVLHSATQLQMKVVREGEKWKNLAKLVKASGANIKDVDLYDEEGDEEGEDVEWSSSDDDLYSDDAYGDGNTFANANTRYCVLPSPYESSLP